MNPERWRQVEQLYNRALEREPGERGAFLAEACGNDEDLRSEVQSLLGHDCGLVDQPAWEAAASLLIDLRATRLEPGIQLGPYEILGRLGAGGMGTVYKARDSRLGRTVAIKVVDARFNDRFEREARAIAALNHPNICTLYDVGPNYLVMEMVEGETLAARLNAGPLPLDLVLRYGAEIAGALAAANVRGIIHRDLKPSNLMITALGIKVLDFGLAKFAEAAGETGLSLSDSGGRMLLGTPAYMSPEQSRGEPLDGRTDIFSLGCVLYEAAIGRPAFRGASVMAVLHEVATSNPPMPSTVRPEIPKEWDLILGRALAKDKERRYASADEMKEALETLRHPSLLALWGGKSEPEPLVGREKEMLKLDALLDRALGGSGKVVLVTGEPGIGKTALTGSFLHSIERRHPDLLVGRGACVELYGTGEAYLPFLEAVSGLLAGTRREKVAALLRRHAPTWCLQFPSIFSGASMEEFQREAIGATKERMLRELGDALSEMTAAFPVILLLEDLHWADPSSVDLLRHMGERARGLRLLLLGTARPEDIERDNRPLRNCKSELQTHGVCEEIELSTLGRDHIAQYLDSHFAPNTFPPELAELIFRKTEGHPLFATGMLQLLAERSDILRRDGAWSLARPVREMNIDIPDSVRGMIRRKIEGLDDEDRRVLQYAAIEGEEFLSVVVANLLECDELTLEERLDRLERVHQLVKSQAEEELPDGSLAFRYRFSHALYQNFLYDELPSKRRLMLHRRAGEALLQCYGNQTARIATALATHFERGRDYPRAVHFVTQAGDNAAALYDHAAAAAHFAHGLDLVEKLPPESQLSSRIALHHKRGAAHLSQGLLADAETEWGMMLTAARAAGLPEAECTALCALCHVQMLAHNIEDLEDNSSQALRVAERIGSRALWSEAMCNEAIGLEVVGRVWEGLARFDEAIPVARSLGHYPALINGLTYRGTCNFMVSLYEQAESDHAEAVRLAGEARDGFYLAISLFYLGLDRANRGRISDSLSALDEALQIARRNGNLLALSRLPNGFGWVYREIGDLTRAIEYNEACVETARGGRIAEAEANGLINLVYDYTLAAQPGKALDAMQAIDPLFDRDRWNRWRFFDIRHKAAVAEFWLAQGNLDRTEEYAATLLTNATRHGVPKYIAVAHRLLGEAATARGDAHTAEEQLTNSLAVLANNPAPLVEWRSRAALGRLLAGNGRPAAALLSFQGAAEVVRRIESCISDPELRVAFLEMQPVREVLARAH